MIPFNDRLPEAEVGFYTGLVESATCMAEVFVLGFWCYLADRIGRKPALVYSITGIAFRPALFGLSRNITQMALLRTGAQAYAWFSMSDFIGTFIGPILGGSLADPKHRTQGNPRPTPSPGTCTTADHLLAAHQITRHACRAVHLRPGLPHHQLLHRHAPRRPLHTNRPRGHRLHNAAEISLYIGAQAASQALWLVVVFPHLQQRIGAKGVLRVCSLGPPLFFSSFILMNVLLRTGGTACTACIWALTFLSTFVGPAVFMSFAGMQLLVNDATPEPSLLGRVNANALMLCGVIRIAAPSIATVVYAVGVRGQIAGDF
ncbi:hypothetical protein V2G26_012113 [Clonostachys chloroleuca]